MIQIGEGLSVMWSVAVVGFILQMIDVQGPVDVGLQEIIIIYLLRQKGSTGEHKHTKHIKSYTIKLQICSQRCRKRVCHCTFYTVSSCSTYCTLNMKSEDTPGKRIKVLSTTFLHNEILR